MQKEKQIIFKSINFTMNGIFLKGLQKIHFQIHQTLSNEKSRPLATLRNDSDDSLLKSPKKRKKFFQFMKSKKGINTETNEKILFNRAIYDYLNIDYDPNTNFKQFWLKNKTRFPRFFELVLKFSSIPEFSGPVEQLFSKSGFIDHTEQD
ncbi:hypothetical protein BpHYR1_026412 [Brachionus plicatilis]|uniref:HAT C-terminal dimerisation domain-containing protein n=1 Tax=Brachionus plicatilis TaxID=10195 RepID=A0A3M7PJC3_BRAPC|nr:hypothetical protein BpHYR1_026412 [Brachionus plicatilis]